jgi:hypothetical protein
MPRHRHADIIIEWTETGKELQYRSDIGWIDIVGSHLSSSGIPLFHENVEFRFKPEVIKYKRYICRVSPSNKTLIRIHMIDSIAKVDSSDGFIEWIDQEWQEIEL